MNRKMIKHEDQELNEILESDTFVESQEYLDYFLKLSSLELTNSHNQGNNTRSSHHSSSLLHIGSSSSEPPKSLSNYKLIKLFWRSKWTRPACLIWLCFAILKFTLVAAIHLRHDKLLKEMGINDATGRKCSQDEDDSIAIATGDSNLNQKINYYRVKLDFLGDPLMSIVGLPVTAFYFGIMLPVTFYLTNYISAISKNYQVDYLSFLVDPRGERIRFKRELAISIRDLIQSPRYTEGFHEYSCLYQETKIEKFERSDLNGILLDIERFNLIKPANLRNEWLRVLSNIVRKVFKLLEPLLSGSSLLIVTFLVMMELYLRIKRRLDIIKCKMVKITPTLMDLSVSSSNHSSVIGSDDWINELDNFVSALSLETRQYFTFGRLLFLSEYYIIIKLSLIWGTLKATLFQVSIWHNLEWSHQIGQQLDTCIELIADSGFKRATGNNNDNNNYEDRRLMMLVSSYLNYALYRDHFGKFKRAASSFASQMMLLVGIYFAVVYYVASSVDSTFKSLNFVYLTGAAFLLNLFLVSCSYILTDSEKIMRKISTIIAEGAAIHDTKHKLSISLWRRQLLDNSELKNHYAIKPFGAEIDKNMIVTMNLYIIALMILHR